MSLAMSVEDRQKFLADMRVGIVSIARAGDRGPLTVPIWYDYEPGGPVRMITDPDSLKGRVLKGVTRISLCAQSEALPYAYVSVEGPYRVRELREGELESMAIRYLGEEMGRAYAADGGGNNIVVELETANWLTVAYPSP